MTAALSVLYMGYQHAESSAAEGKAKSAEKIAATRSQSATKIAELNVQQEQERAKTKAATEAYERRRKYKLYGRQSTFAAGELSDPLVKRKSLLG